MTLTDDVQHLFFERGLDRDDALVAAKAIGQKIIDESKSTSTPLGGIVYEVWGLYDDGMPACRFARAEDAEEGALVFAGKFRTAEGGSFAERRRTLTLQDLEALVEEAPARRPLE